MKSKRTLAVDYGSKRIGLALSDELGILASTAGVIDNSSNAVGRLVHLAKENRCTTVILGLPTTLNGGQSQWTETVMVFGQKLMTELSKHDIAFAYYDERFTSVIAEANIRQAHSKRSKLTDKSLRDAEAARILLQDWLEKNKT